VIAAVLDRPSRRLHNSVVDRPQTIIATTSWTATALAILLVGAGGCYLSYGESGDVDERMDADAAAETHADADVAVEADAEAEIDTGADADDGDAVADEGDADADAGTCVGGWYDPTSGLCWEDPPGGTTRSWDDAVTYCDGLSLGSYGPGSWHLPTVSELRSMIRGCPDTESGGSCGLTDACLETDCRDDSCLGCSFLGGPGTAGAYWPSGLGGPALWYWSSCAQTTHAWYVFFSYGDVDVYVKTSTLFVRCVRPGP
jgi:hypothetical protein